MRLHHRTPLVVWLLGVILALPVLGYYLLTEGPRYYYQWIELPAVRAEIQHLPGVIFRGIRDLGAPGEPSPEVILEIAQKGRIALYRPTQESFRGGGPLVISGIGTCGKTAVFSVAHGNNTVASLQFATVAELLGQYDRVHQVIQEGGYCAWQDSRGPTPN